MTILTVEGVIEDGMVRLKGKVNLPEKTKVYVIVPEVEYGESQPNTAQISSPRLAVREQAADFRMEVSEEPDDAPVQ